MVLNTVADDVPFNIVFLDIWSPGDVPDKHTADVKILTMVDAMTGFAAASRLKGEVDAITVATSAMTDFCQD